MPAVDAPNVNGARMLGLVPGDGGDEVRAADVVGAARRGRGGPRGGALRLRPGPGRLDRRHRTGLSRRARSGLLPLLIVQGVLLTDLARAADFVLPGASFVEKEASYTNDQGRLQGTARAIADAGRGDGGLADSRRTSRAALGVPFDYASAAQVRADIAARYAGQPGFAETVARSRSAARWRRGTGCRRRIRRSAGSGISCSRICRR